MFIQCQKWSINLYKIVKDRKSDPRILWSAKLSPELQRVKYLTILEKNNEKTKHSFKSEPNFLIQGKNCIVYCYIKNHHITFSLEEKNVYVIIPVGQDLEVA